MLATHDGRNETSETDEVLVRLSKSFYDFLELDVREFLTSLNH